MKKKIPIITIESSSAIKKDVISLLNKITEQVPAKMLLKFLTVSLSNHLFWDTLHKDSMIKENDEAFKLLLYITRDKNWNELIPKAQQFYGECYRKAQEKDEEKKK